MHKRSQFQSTPVITDGRTGRAPARARAPRCFNPRPSSLTGERGMAELAVCATWFQSTPVITDGRTGPTASSTRWRCGFNPRPSSLTGEQRLRVLCGDDRMFQSTPVITDGRTWLHPSRLAKTFPFQSTPVITDGRTARPQAGSAGGAGFNPRPSSLTGELVGCM